MTEAKNEKIASENAVILHVAEGSRTKYKELSKCGMPLSTQGENNLTPLNSVSS